MVRFAKKWSKLGATVFSEDAWKEDPTLAKYAVFYTPDEDPGEDDYDDVDEVADFRERWEEARGEEDVGHDEVLSLVRFKTMLKTMLAEAKKKPKEQQEEEVEGGGAGQQQKSQQKDEEEEEEEEEQTQQQKTQQQKAQQQKTQQQETQQQTPTSTPEQLAAANARAAEDPFIAPFTNAQSKVGRHDAATIMACSGKPLATTAERERFLNACFGAEDEVDARIVLAKRDAFTPQVLPTGASAGTVAAAVVAAGLRFRWTRYSESAADSDAQRSKVHVVVRTVPDGVEVGQTAVQEIKADANVCEWPVLAMKAVELSREAVECALFMNGREIGGVRFDADASGSLAQLLGGAISQSVRVLQSGGASSASSGDLCVELAGVPPSTAAHAEDLDLIFSAFDGDGSLSIDPKELAAMLAILGHPNATVVASLAMIKKYSGSARSALAKDDFHRLLEEEDIAQSALLHVAAAKAGISEPRTRFDLTIPVTQDGTPLGIDMVVHPLSGKAVVIEVKAGGLIQLAGGGARAVAPGDQIDGLNGETFAPFRAVPPADGIHDRHDLVNLIRRVLNRETRSVDDDTGVSLPEEKADRGALAHTVTDAEVNGLVAKMMAAHPSKDGMMTTAEAMHCLAENEIDRVLAKINAAKGAERVITFSRAASASTSGSRGAVAAVAEAAEREIARLRQHIADSRAQTRTLEERKARMEAEATKQP